MRPSSRFVAAALCVVACAPARGANEPVALRTVAVLQLSAGAGVDAALAGSVSDAVAASVAKLQNVEVVTRQQVQALLEQEASKQLAGCDSEGCQAQLAHALGAHEIVAGTLSHVGKSWLFALRRVDAASGKARAADRRLVDRTIDDVLDAIPGMVGELFDASVDLRPGAAMGTGTSPSTTSSAAGASPSTTAGKVAPAPKPASTADRPATIAAAARARFVLYTDGAGRYVAVDPQAGSFEPFYAGTKDALYAQRVSGGGREGTKAWSMVFWEPRVAARWQGELSSKDGAVKLQCGDQSIPLTVVKDAKKLLAAAKLYDVRWQRRLAAAARDDDGTWYVVDVAREPDDARDHRLYVGRKGALRYVPVEDAMIDRGGAVFLTSGGKLVLDADAPVYVEGGATKKVKPLVIEDVARDVYGRIGLYDEPLGTPCDGRL